MSSHNPIGTDGFDFLEYTTLNPQKLTQQFEAMGFTATHQHHTHDVTLFEQNDIRFFINTTNDSMAKHFADEHGASVSAMGWRVADAKTAFDHAIANGATAYTPNDEKKIYDMPAIRGVGNSLIYFVDYKSGTANYRHHLKPLAVKPNSLHGHGLTYIDHVTHNLHRGHMTKWADFYSRLFNFHQVRYFDIEGKLTGLKSKAMTSPCGKIRIPLNESSDDHSQIEEFIREFHGEGIQHIALGTKHIFHSVEKLCQNNLEFLHTPDTYFELIESRLPNHGDSWDLMKKFRILIDGTTKNEKKILLQIFTKNMLGPVFFEVIQRKGDEGFGEGNFRALFESIELDQIRRGVLDANMTNKDIP